MSGKLITKAVPTVPLHHASPLANAPLVEAAAVKLAEFEGAVNDALAGGMVLAALTTRDHDAFRVYVAQLAPAPLDFSTKGAESGRWSSNQPTLSNMPRESRPGRPGDNPCGMSEHVVREEELDLPFEVDLKPDRLCDV